MEIKNICCIGAGYVGGPTMAVIALKCPNINVTVVDMNKEKIQQWNGNLEELPVYEPGLKDVVAKVRNKNLFFTNKIDESIQKSELIFMAVNTPTKTDGDGAGMAADLSFVESCAKNIALVSTSDKIVIEKSTLPVRTAEKIKTILKENNKNCHFEVISNPEFLAEGSAIQDLFKSDRVLIGGDTTESGKKAVKALVDIYSNWIPKNKIITTNVWSSELSKLASNAMLAQRISSINSLSAICEKTGADTIEVSNAVGMDHRIGSYFLSPSPGFGGSCFQKDILNLVYLCRHYGLHEVAEFWHQVIKINNYQRKRIVDKVDELCEKDYTKKITILGWSFKKNTNDTRESSSIYISYSLLNMGYKLNIYDPKVSDERIHEDLLNLNQTNNNNIIFSDRINICNSLAESVDDRDIVLILTEWDEFKNFKTDAKIIDTRNIYNGNNFFKL
ncbi:nucleotide sugar dehydrogenase [Flavobacteriaceae bacterium]|nr:nucleotide sugar dehydrogenase [Flavobacteriaceae bacterium]